MQATDMSVQSTISEMRLLCTQGQAPRALVLAQTLCSQHPDSAPAWLARAEIHARVGDYAGVASACRRVIDINPRDFTAHFNLGIALIALKRHRDAVTIMEHATAIEPGHLPIRILASQIYRQLGDLAHAEVHISAAKQRNPDDPAVNHELGIVMLAKGHPDNALVFFGKTLTVNPRNAEALYFMGMAHWQLNDADNAIASYRAAIIINKDYAEAYNNLGHVYHELGDIGEAIKAFTQFVRIRPDASQGHHNLAVALESIGKFTEATQHYEIALRLDPDNIAIRNHYGYMLIDSGNYMPARQQFMQVLADHPNDIDATVGLSNILQKERDYQAAYALIKPAMESDAPPHVDLAKIFASISIKLGLEETAIRYARSALQSTGLTNNARSDLHACLGRLYENSGDHHQAFSHHMQANKLHAGKYSPDTFEAQVDDIIDVFSIDRIAGLPASSIQSDLPLFIVGMPRSGTTLIEQIIDCHPQAYGAGELTDISDLARDRALRLSYPHGIDTLKQEDMDSLAKRYLARLRKFSPSADRIVDKMPHNFKFLGLIDVLFPAARVIHVSRDPMDTCLSLYFHTFNAMHAYSNDLAHLGHYYRQYQRLMKHWTSVLRIPLLTVQYEELVSDTELVVRRILEFCGLSWDARCLDFHKSNRTVITPSQDQVRQPIYTDSIGRWRRYASELEPLRQALETDD